MAIPLSGPLSLTNIQTEFGGTNPIGLSEYYRNGGLVPNAPQNAPIPTSGAISIGNFYGSTNRIPIAITLSASAYNYDVYANRGGSYVAGISDITVTVAPGVYIGSTSTGAYAMIVSSSFNAGDTVTIVNNGTIEGMGGNGGDSQFAAQSGGNPGAGGGNALYVARATTIQNNSTIAGGGGGGGGGSGWTPNKGGSGWGGGGGGGAGYNPGSGGGGGYPGSSGSLSAGGAGNPGDFQGISGGAGGGLGSPGAGGSATGGANPRPGGAGGAAGYYLVGTSFVTWTATGTRLGLVA
jgi:hypothetical protein